MLLFYSSETAGKLLLTKDMLLLSLCFAYTGEAMSYTLELEFLQLSMIFDVCNKCINACVANGGWVLKDLGTETNNPNPGWWNTP